MSCVGICHYNLDTTNQRILVDEKLIQMFIFLIKHTEKTLECEHLTESWQIGLKLCEWIKKRKVLESNQIPNIVQY